MTLNFSHFTAALVFSLCASVIFGITQRDNSKQMIRYGLYGMGAVVLEAVEL
jgi:hypothetical protein